MDPCANKSQELGVARRLEEIVLDSVTNKLSRLDGNSVTKKSDLHTGMRMGTGGVAVSKIKYKSPASGQ